MTDPAFILAISTLITSIGTLIGILWGVIVSSRNGRAIQQVHAATNSMKDELVESTRVAALAKGLKQGRDEAAATKD